MTEVPRCDAVVIAAACRSGTKYTATVLEKLGLLATHEGVFHEDGFRNWTGILVDVSCWVPHYWESNRDQNHVRVLHQVRDPLESIGSNAAHWVHSLSDVFVPGKRSLLDQADHIQYPELLRHPDPLEKAMVYWVLQNRWIETNFRTVPYKVESGVPATARTIFGLLDLDPLPEEAIEDVLASVPTDTNPLPDYAPRSRFRGLTLSDLPDIKERDDLAEIMERYGYAT